MTVNAGAAPAPDDDEPPDAESWFTRVAPRRGISLEPDISLASDDSRDSALEPGISLQPGISLVVAPEIGPGISVAVPSDATTGDPAKKGVTTDAESPLLTLTTPAAAEAAAPAVAATPTTSLANDRSRFALPFTGPGLTGLGGVLLGCLVVGLGAATDLALGGGLGRLFTVAFLLGCALVALAVRIRSLAVALVLPPLLFAGGYGLETKTGGQTTGLRPMALDVATSLALQAPILFIGTAVAFAIALVRLAVHLVRR